MPDPSSPLRPKSDWHSRNYLPHWEAGEAAQSLTFRLDDAIPFALRERWREEAQRLSPEQRDTVRAKEIEAALDVGHGEALLANPVAATIVQNALLHFDGERYRLHAWCVMPTHVHVLATPLADHSLSAIMHSWKSFSAVQINRALGRRGTIWFPEYFDRKIRSERHFEAARFYIEENPVKAGLCRSAGEWRFSSASGKG